MAGVTTRNFKKASSKAIADTQLQAALDRAGAGFDDARLDAIGELSRQRWEELRASARETKRHTIDNLDYYLELASERVMQNGGQVHFAKDAAEARAIVLELARSNGVRVVTKSKSMVSEEIELNHALGESGIEAVETDLGEYIIQLAEETPFHIIAPAMHKSRQQVSQLFSEKINRPGLVEIDEMAQVARQTLREKFFLADMGITGANFIVAETGTVVIVTNEGNGRFCTSAPRIHVALTGMEKIVPSLEDLPVFLRLLPRAATGQRMTSYVSFISGPRDNDEEDGPDEFHLVVVDNGRSRLLSDPVLRESLYCIRCGACLNICPVYRKVGGHSYGWVYPGPIGAVVSPMLVGLEQAKDLPHASSLCGACHEVCPVKINIPHMLLNLRTRLVESENPEERGTPVAHRILAWGYYQTMKSPRILSLVRRLALFLQTPLKRKGKLRSIPVPPFSRWTRDRDLPALLRQVIPSDMGRRGVQGTIARRYDSGRRCPGKRQVHRVS